MQHRAAGVVTGEPEGSGATVGATDLTTAHEVPPDRAAAVLTGTSAPDGVPVQVGGEATELPVVGGGGLEATHRVTTAGGGVQGGIGDDVAEDGHAGDLDHLQPGRLQEVLDGGGV